MSMLITLDEYTNAEKLLHEKLKGLESTPMAIAMLASSIGFLVKTRKPEGLIRELVERAIRKASTQEVVMPTHHEVAAMFHPERDRE